MSPEHKMHEWIAARALEWFVAHRAGDLNEAQQERFIDWLRASPEHVREYLALTGLSEDMKQLAGRFTEPSDVLIAQARADIDSVQALFPAEDEEPARMASIAPGIQRPRFHAWAVAAGVATVAVALTVFSAWHLHDRSDYSTAHAEQRSWRMPDGSTVHLNSGSQIKVRFDEQHREVELIKGQALFQVAKDARRPFWVRTGDAAVQAVGTQFDVYRQPRRTLISVVEGRVAVWRLQKEAPSEPVAQIDAGQQARISRESAVVSRKADDVRKTVAWLQRQVVFDHDSLGAAVEEFNRYSEVSIRIDEPSLRTAEVSGIFSAYDAEAFIRFLEHQPDMHVERTATEVVVTAAAVP
jgi:transmembrane sensor